MNKKINYTEYISNECFIFLNIVHFYVDKISVSTYIRRNKGGILLLRSERTSFKFKRWFYLSYFIFFILFFLEPIINDPHIQEAAL